MNNIERKLKLHKPPIILRLGERLGIMQVRPSDICPLDQLDLFYRTYRDLAGDPDIGWGNVGGCQSWQGVRGWWKEFIEIHSSIQNQDCLHETQ